MTNQREKTKTFVIIDANAVIHRSYHALPPLTALDGTLVNAVYGFTTLLLKVLRELRPEYLVAAFDLAGPTFRHLAYEAYKATRVKAPDELYAQIPLVKKILEAFSVPIFEKEGFEADDVIGTVTELLRDNPAVSCIIVTGDLDTLQLVDRKTSVYTLKSGVKETTVYDADGVQKRFGIQPLQLPDFKGLKGDPSDNIPGVPGVGDKTAAALLQKFGSLEKLYETLEKEKGEKMWDKPLTPKLAALLGEYKDQAFFSKELATINRRVPLEFDLEAASRKHYERERVVELFRSLGFFSIVDRLPPDGTTPQADVSQAPQAARGLGPEAPGELQGVREVILDVISDTILGKTAPRLLVLGIPNREVFWFDLTREKTLPAYLRERIEDQEIAKITRSAKPLYAYLHERGATLRGVVMDIELAYQLIHPGVRDTALAKITLDELGEELQEPMSREAESSRRAEVLARLERTLAAKLERQGLARVFREIELPLTPILVAMEQAGIALDQDRIATLSRRIRERLGALEAEIHKEAGQIFNINSPAQLGAVLFKKLGVGTRRVRKTAGGALSTDARELEKLRQDHPIVQKILAYRELFKLQTTYLDALAELLSADGRIHTTFRQLGAATGRLSSSDPNVQNIPIRGEFGQDIRRIFIAREGWELLSADYSQLELRIAASLSRDPVMLEAFGRGQDIHAKTASLVFDVAVEAVSSEMRRQAKTLNFGILYGMGPQAFAEAAGMSMEQAKSFIEEYFREFAALRGYLEALKAEGAAKGYVSTIFGRRRYLPELGSPNVAVRRAGERMAINMPIQGAAADIVKLAMIRVTRALQVANLASRCRLLLQVHDELVFEVERDTLQDAAQIIRATCEGAVPLDVPLYVDLKHGPNWGDLETV